MTKTVNCPNCGGYGIITECTDYSISGQTCENCGGTGTIEVPMDTADYIRGMNYEQLASLLLDFYLSGMDDVSTRLNLTEKQAEIEGWLKRTDIY